MIIVFSIEGISADRNERSGEDRLRKLEDILKYEDDLPIVTLPNGEIRVEEKSNGSSKYE